MFASIGDDGNFNGAENGKAVSQVDMVYGGGAVSKGENARGTGMSFSTECDKNFTKGDPWLAIELAKHRLRSRLPPTSLRRGRALPVAGFEVYYKCDHFRMTGSYKERGGLNALLQLTASERKAGVIAASAGNHAQALAHHGNLLGVPVTVVMPVDAPITKVENCRLLNANVLCHGASFAEAKDRAMQIAEEKGMKYINGYDHPDVIAGAGTCGLEIIQQLPEVDAILVPVGGGGLISGISVAVKRINHNIKVIGIESEQCPSMTNALKAGHPVDTPVLPGGTIADGLAVTRVGDNAFSLIQRYVDEVITVPEEFISIAILHLLEKEKLLTEGAGCTALAAILGGKLDYLKGKKVVVVLCGGNIDMTALGRVLNRGLYSSGRLMTFDCAISDRVGGLARFSKALCDTGASVKEIVQEHPYVSDLYICSVHVVVETLSFDHCRDVIAKMKTHGYTLKVVDDKKYDDVDIKLLHSAKL